MIMFKFAERFNQSLARYDIRLAPHDILASQVRYHTESISPVPQETNIIEKDVLPKGLQDWNLLAL